MSGWLNALPVMLPLLTAAVFARRGRARSLAVIIAPWLPLALLVPLWQADASAAPVLLLGLRLGVDAFSAPLLLLSALAWTLAGVFARGAIRRGQMRFWVGWLVSLAGMSLVLLAADLAGFYAGYATLSLASWLLVIHARSDQAWHAGRVYLVITLLGEMAVFAAVVAIAAGHGNVALGSIDALPLADHWRWLALAGFAVKMGVFPLHVWLPLAHPVAPVPSSAILSGVIVKAGLLGWLRLVPPGIEHGIELAPVLFGLGLFTAFFGVAVGLLQRQLKVVLAYSTISQMGLVLVLYALMLAGGSQEMAPWLGLLVLHHGLNKAALFIACGCAPGRGWLRGVLVALPALALTGAPLTTGMLAKAGIKQALATSSFGAGWATVLGLSSTATALLLWHFWRLARADRKYRHVRPAWVVLVLSALFVPWAWLAIHDLDAHLLGGLWAASWPLLLAAGLIALLRGLPRPPALPAGDLVILYQSLARYVVTVLGRIAGLQGRALPNLHPVHVRLNARFLDLEQRLTALPVAGLLVLGIGGLLWLFAR
ncbi:MAG: proton-conducting transporter membrane subunit [Wenzhouxiangellaceae bacterium]|nr:proton-conducting transporter membrane subunit [Wenzhouxiangellaceae bacterium]